MDEVVEQLRALAEDAAIRSVPKLLKTAAGEGLKATKKQAEEPNESLRKHSRQGRPSAPEGMRLRNLQKAGTP